MISGKIDSWPTFIRLKPVKGVSFFSLAGSLYMGELSLGVLRPRTGVDNSGLNQLSDLQLGFDQTGIAKWSSSCGQNNRLLKLGLFKGHYRTWSTVLSTFGVLSSIGGFISLPYSTHFS